MAGKKRKTKKFLTIERTAALVIGVFVITFLSFGALGIIEYFEMNKYVKADILKVIDTTIVVGNNCTAIIAETSPERANSIELGLEKKINVRPNTHDIFADVLKNFNITLERATIDRYEDGIYYATLYLKRGNEELRMDSKPSDAMAIALRMESPIYIKKNLLESQGKNICK